jgi:tetratricopeptide (TPR) repeat protein
MTKNFNQNEIIEFCNKYLKVNPTDKVLREKLVEIYKKNKIYVKAQNELEKLIRHGDGTGAVYADLGMCYYHIGRKKEALQAFEKAKKLGKPIPQKFFDKINSEIKIEGE